MKDKDNSSQKKSSKSSGARSAKRTGSGDSARRSSAAVTAGRPSQLEARFRAVFENSRVAIGVSKSGIHAFVNPAYHDLFGYPPGSDLAGKPVLDLIAPESRDQIKAVPSTYETRGLRADGTAFDMEVNVSSYQENGEDHTLVILRDITERKRAEEEIAERGVMLQQIMDTASVAIFLVDRSGRIVHANRRMAEMFGCSMKELVGSEYVDHVHPSERESGRRKMLALLASEIPSVELERLYWRKDGTEFWGQLAGRRFHDVRGNELGLIGVITDIDKRKRSELALRQSEEKYRRLYNETPVLLHSIDRNGIVVEVNDYWLKAMGYERSEVIGRKVTDFHTSESRKYALDVVQPAFFRDGIATEMSYQFVKKNGEVVDVLLSATAERDAAGNVVRSRAVIEDITERKRMEEDLRRSEERYRDLFENAIDPIVIVDDKQNFKEVNKRVVELFGYSREELLSMNVRDMIPPEQLPRSENAFSELSRHGAYQQFIGKVRKKDGTFVDIEVSSSSIMDNGRIIGSRDIIRDITERKRAETALQESERSLATLMGNLPGMAYRCRNDRNWTIEYVSEGAVGLTGYQPAELIGNAKIAYNDLIHPDDQAAVWNAVQQAVGSRDKYTLNYRIRRADGKERRVWEQGQGVFSDAGELLALEGFITDVTDSRLLEEERLKTQKLESIGTLAGGIAHDFNNLLQGVFGYISMARLTFDQKEKSLAMLAQAEKALHQSVNLTAQLLTFSKGGMPVKKILDLRPVIENSVAFALSGSRVTCEIVVDKDLRTVEADEGQIGQVIQNIVLNADQAMPLGGMIRVSVRNMTAAAIVPNVDLQGDLVEIAIRDQGNGIPAEHLVSIFDPYFTTKEKGSGLGLATAYSIIKNHGGLVRVRSEIGKGTTFYIYLPASNAAVEELESPAIPAAIRQARILVMDDEEMIRAVARELLTAIGHDVVCAESGENALEAYQAARDAGAPFDLVILDLTIRGGMGGIETMRKMVEIDPDVRAVVSSGYSDDAAFSNYRKQGFRAFLKKPYNMEELQSTLNALLA